ncbi:hypothetical protein HanRHA438_Chr11g0511531 [Helianthus annuus]|nr:hypothetical protein HanHA300_Chr11g0409371 [Helianthus annuus]KAJ0518064.1 hypothetical protein HanHA89_Chr11g0433021 [Helianthus annuus]KAJ0686091.1 hypothetical protein HanLR1_Chr11g0410631 [Helianthus annuus]KAJ0689938.1 hypothetical protein HanOQP8_Chr11g0411991 [Helianthus annuus]KAJ0871369.1 hypothetical protein HanRHA438_Chr11g0511531 [Helianthus annuus]
MARMLVDIPIPPKWKQLWDTWDLRCFIVLSLLLQTFLIFVAPLRKRTKSYWIVMPLWSAYLLADATANFAVGLISNSMGNPGENAGKKSRTPAENTDLLAFWAPFLLVHLGGPDTITAFALEDNELWLRHLLGLVFQCLAAVYVFVQSLPDNRLWIPTTLMFVTGMIKYAERTRSLYLASADKFKESMLTGPDPGPNYAKLMDEYASKKKSNLPTSIEMTEELDTSTKSANKAKKGRLKELEVVQYGHVFFEKFRGLIVDTIFSQKERNFSRDFFLNRTAKDAFRVIEVELNFIYEVLFTKLPVVYDVERDNSLKSRIITCLLGVLLPPRIEANLQGTTGNSETKTCGRRMGRRWSETIGTFNLIDYCLHKQYTGKRFRQYIGENTWEKVFIMLGVNEFLDSIIYVKPQAFTGILKEFIFKELKSKSELADDLDTAKEISLARGDWVLRVEDGWAGLLKYVAGVDYDQSLILWHIATELLYNQDPPTDSSDKDKENRDNSKLLSDYMLYLLIMESSMMSAVAGIAQIRFRDTCAEAKRFFVDMKDESKGKNDDGKLKNACNEIYKVVTEVEPVAIKGDRSKSLLFDGCILAKELVKIENSLKKNKWEIISKVWVELLCYAATHSRANMQAAQVSRGGELITIVWLLMSHFGLGEQFQINEGQSRAKLVVGK